MNFRSLLDETRDFKESDPQIRDSIHHDTYERTTSANSALAIVLCAWKHYFTAVEIRCGSVESAYFASLKTSVLKGFCYCCSCPAKAAVRSSVGKALIAIHKS